MSGAEGEVVSFFDGDQYNTIAYLPQVNGHSQKFRSMAYIGTCSLTGESNLAATGPGIYIQP